MAKKLIFGSILFCAVVFSITQYKKKLHNPTQSKQETVLLEEKKPQQNKSKLVVRSIEDLNGLPIADRIKELFDTTQSKLPIVKTVRYTSRAQWLPGKSAWLSDYASHFKTSKHFIARSVNNGKPNYQSQILHQGDRFNVYDENREFEYHIVVDVSRCRAWLYCYDHQTDENILLKTYLVGLGRLDEQKQSGSLTPLGIYKLGDRIATYKPQKYDYYKGNHVEMIRVFGTRWIPFGQEVENCSEPYEGFGLHGCPWQQDEASEQLVENRSELGKYTTDGCIHFSQEDMEEIYAIVVTKPTFVQIIQDFQECKLPKKQSHE